MKQFKNCSKLNLKSFLMSYHEINLDIRKASKRELKEALRIGPVALRIGQILHRIGISLCFDCDLGFSLMEDVLPM